MASQTSIREQITQQIVDGLRQGVVPWRKPWRNDANSGSPSNIVSKKPYRGINTLVLDLVAMQRGYQSRWWGTFRQWSELGGKIKRRPAGVRSGDWATTAVFCKQVEKIERNQNGEEETVRYPLLRSYKLFNLDQVDGVSLDRLRAGQEGEGGEEARLYDRHVAADDLIAATSADIRLGGNRAYYVRPEPVDAFPRHSSGDYIQSPRQWQYNDANAYYETMFHELAHWAEVRLGWSGTYAMGELVAEMASCFVASELGIPVGDDLENHQGYLADWLTAMNADPKVIFSVASQASRVADYLLGFGRKQELTKGETSTVEI